MRNYLFLCLGITISLSQVYKFNTYDLPESTYINRIHHLHSGKLAIASSSGLHIFDSDEFHYYSNEPSDTISLTDKKVYSIHEDEQNQIWIGTFRGLNQLMLTDEGIKFKRIPKFFDTRIKSMASHNDDLYIIDDFAFMRYNTKSTEIDTLLYSRQIWYSARVDNNIYLSHRSNVLRYNIESSTIDTLVNIPQPSFENAFYVQDNKLYISNYRWAGHVDLTTRAVTSIGLVNLLQAHVKRQFKKTNQSTVLITGIIPVEGFYWISTLSHGIFIVNDKGEIIENLHKDGHNSSGLISNSISFMNQTSDGMIYIGGTKGEIAIYNQQNALFDHFKTSMNKEFVVGITTFDQDEILITDLNGFTIFNSKSKRMKRMDRPDLKISRATVVKRYGDKIYICNGQLTLYILNMNLDVIKTITTKSLGYKSMARFMMDFIVDDETLWLTMSGVGLVKYNLKTSEKVVYGRTVIKSKSSGLLDILKHNNTIYIGFITGYIYTFDVISKESKMLENYESVMSKDIREMILVDDQILWIATYGTGLIRYDLQSKTIESYTKDHGFETNNFFGMTINGNSIWLSSSKGISKFEVDSKKITNFDYHDGVLKHEFSRFGYFVDDQKNIYFGGSDGFNRIKEHTVLSDNVYPLEIKRLLIENSIERRIRSNHVINISPEHHFFSISFNRIDYGKNEMISYRYRFSNDEKEWRDIGDTKELFFSNLNYGTYDLEIASTDRYGRWLEDTQHVQFHLEAPFWSTTWFYISVIISSLMLIFYIFYLILRRRFEVEKIRNQIAADLHDDVGADLSKISMYTNVAMRNAQGRPAIDVLRKISRISMTATKKLDDLVWAIDYRNDTIPNFISRLDASTKEIIGDSDIHLEFEKHVSSNVKFVRSNIRMNVLYILKEVLSNIRKYSEATELKVCIRILNKTLRLEVEDNGKTFEINESKGNGLKNIRMRVKKLKANTFKFNTEKGTSLTLEVVI